MNIFKRDHQVTMGVISKVEGWCATVVFTIFNKWLVLFYEKVILNIVKWLVYFMNAILYPILMVLLLPFAIGAEIFIKVRDEKLIADETRRHPGVPASPIGVNSDDINSNIEEI